MVHSGRSACEIQPGSLPELRAGLWQRGLLRQRVGDCQVAFQRYGSIGERLVEAVLGQWRNRHFDIALNILNIVIAVHRCSDDSDWTASLFALESYRTFSGIWFSREVL